ncbi:MAG TPA: cell filamentation protein Fic [Acidimicrobiaceae bacterium]|nr:cell filamentation protein Fic [Acidimicrobiaceae bacterium]
MPDRGPSNPWPELAYEELPWERDYSLPASRTQLRRHRGPYEAAVAPEIADQQVVLDAEIAAASDDAAVEIARFDTEVGHEVAPFAAVLLRSESAASSKIENLTASARAIAEAELSGPSGRNASMVVANQRAMSAAIELANSIDAAAILAMHAALLGHTDPDIAGRWRDQQVWIGGSDLGPHRAVFVPPSHHRVPAAIDDLITFIDRDDIPTLSHAAIAHAQFETIHPFPDGNGRTGRALVHAHLRNKNLTKHATVPVSAGLLTDVDSYFAALTQYRAGDPNPIVEAFASAAFAATANGRTLVEELHSIRRSWHDRVKARRDATAWRVVDLLLRHPVVNASLIAETTGIAPRNAYRALRPLEAADVVVEFTDKKRNQMWRAPELLAALDSFASRAGRRGLSRN